MTQNILINENNQLLQFSSFVKIIIYFRLQNIIVILIYVIWNQTVLFIYISP